MNPAGTKGESALLIHSGALGDFILSLRVVAALRMAGACGVSLLGRPFYAELAGPHEGVEGVFNIETGGFHALFAQEAELPERVIDALQPFELAVNMLGGGDGSIAVPLRRAGVDRVVEIDPRPRADWTQHLSDQWLADLAAGGIGARPGPPRIRMDPAERAAARALLADAAGGVGRIVILHPGSGSRAKCWPAARFVTLAERLRERGARPVFLLGPVEREQLPRQERDSLERTAPLIENPPLRRVAALLAAADLFVGNDSGVSHLAAAVGEPVVAVFGPTDPVRWRPLGGHVRLARREGSAACGGGWPGVRRVLRLCEEALAERSPAA